MNFTEHLKFGLFGGAATAIVLAPVVRDPIELAAISGIVVIGSLFPDLDIHSVPSKIAAICVTVLGIWGIIAKEPYIPLYFTTAFCFLKIFNHRTWLHTYLIPAVSFAVAYNIKSIHFFAFGIGLIIHLVSDRIWPWKLSNWHKLKFPKMLK